MKLLKRVRDFIDNPKKKVIDMLPELLKLHNDLLATENSAAASLDGIVYFFKATSPWYDRQEEIGQIIIELQAVNYGQHQELIQKLVFLRAHIQNAGRDIYGWNRTKKGEAVTADKVFLGNIYGLFTHPVSKWIQGSCEPKGGWGFSGMENLNAYDVVKDQAWTFMRSHVQPMCDLIQWLRREVDPQHAVKAA